MREKWCTERNEIGKNSRSSVLEDTGNRQMRDEGGSREERRKRKEGTEGDKRKIWQERVS